MSGQGQCGQPVNPGSRVNQIRFGLVFQSSIKCIKISCQERYLERHEEGRSKEDYINGLECRRALQGEQIRQGEGNGCKLRSRRGEQTGQQKVFAQLKITSPLMN